MLIIIVDLVYDLEHDFYMIISTTHSYFSLKKREEVIQEDGQDYYRCWLEFISCVIKQRAVLGTTTTLYPSSSQRPTHTQVQSLGLELQGPEEKYFDDSINRRYIEITTDVAIFM